MGVHVKVAGAWQEIGVGGGGGGMPWAKVSGGTVTTVNNSDGSVDEVHTFTANGTLTVNSPGYARVFMISAGGPGWNNAGAGGRVKEGIFSLPAGAQAVVVGQGASGDPTAAGIGNPSMLGALSTFSAGQFVSSGTSGTGTRGSEYVTDISGTSQTYGKYGDSANKRANRGDGGWAGDNSAGSSGVVIVRVQQTPPTVIGVAASGGTESTYVGDGTNGVLGQTYKVHKFETATANGAVPGDNLISALNVASGGLVDVLVIGGGGCGGMYMGATGGGGGAGGWLELFSVHVDVGSVPVQVGAGGAWNYNGGDSRFGQYWSPGGGKGNLYSNGPSAGASGGGGAQGIYPFGNSGNAGTAGGGGGAGGANSGGTGGPGKQSYMDGTLRTYCKGGDAGGNPGYTAAKSSGNGGVGASGDGGANQGGSGVVIVRYPIETP